MRSIALFVVTGKTDQRNGVAGVWIVAICASAVTFDDSASVAHKAFVCDRNGHWAVLQHLEKLLFVGLAGLPRPAL